MLTPTIHKALDLHQPAPYRPFADPSPAERRANLIRSSILDDNWPRKVAAFRALFSLNQHDHTGAAFGSVLRPDRTALHQKLLHEEFTEVCVGADNGSLSETVDGLLDLIYVALGWLSELGFTPEEQLALMQEVHASNLTKTDDKGLPVFSPTGKVLKGDNYLRADIEGLLARMTEARRAAVDPLTSAADCATPFTHVGEGTNG